MINSGRIYNTEYYLLHPIVWLSDLWQDVRWFFQRGSRGWADCDWWMLNDYLIEWLPDALREMAEKNHGCTNELFDHSREGDECWRWTEILIKMAEGFEAQGVLLDDFGDLTEVRRDELEEKWREGSELFIKYFPALWD